MGSFFTWRRTEYLVGSLISIVAFFVYIKTMCPTVSFIDSGELAVDAYTLGIAHPTGYPLFTILGWLFSHLPLGFRVIYQLNLMSAFFCSFGLFFFFRFLVFFIGEFLFSASKEIRPFSLMITEKNMFYVFVPAAVGTLFLAFSETYWSQALSIEVYSLHIFFLAILLLLFSKAIHSARVVNLGNDSQRNGMLYWYCFAFALGLSFTNHMTTILLAPGFLFLYFHTFRFTKASWIRIFRMVLPFLAGFSVYLYLPFRANEHPLMNWGDPTSLERFLWHFTGKVYRVWLFSSTESAGKQFKYFIDSLPSEFSYYPYIFAVLGLWNLLKEKRTIFIFSVLLFVGCVLYSINYDIHDIDSYFLLAYVTIAVWSAIGVRYFLTFIKGQQKVMAFSIAIVLSTIVLVLAHRNDVDESKTLLVEDYTKDMFNSVKPNAIILSYQWDYFVSAAYYFQLVEHVRPDVIIIDKELLRRTWYYKQLATRYPWLIEQSRKEVDAFLAEVNKFEHDLPYDPRVIEYRYVSLIKSFIEKNYASRPIYVTSEVEQEYTTGYQRIPSGLAFRLAINNSIEDSIVANYNFHSPSKKNKYIDGVLSLYSQSYINHAMYFYSSGRMDEAIDCLDKALEIRPDQREVLFLKNKITSGK